MLDLFPLGWCLTQIEELNAKVQDLQNRHWEDANCRSELDMLKAR